MNLNSELDAMRLLIEQRLNGLILATAPSEKSEISQVLLPLLDFAKLLIELDLKLVQPVTVKPKRSYNPFDDIEDDDEDDDFIPDEDDTDLEEWGL